MLYMGGTGNKSCCHQGEEANVANKIRGRGNLVKRSSGVRCYDAQ